MQNPSHLGDRVRDLESVARKKPLSGQKKKELWTRKLNLSFLSRLQYQRIHSWHCQDGEKHDGQRYGTCISNATRTRYICGPTQCFFFRGQHHVCHRPRVWNHKSMRRRAPRGMKKLAHLRATKDPNEIIRRDNRDGHFCAVFLASKTTIREESPAGRLNDSHSGSSSASRQHGNIFFGLGNWKASGLSCSG